MQAAIPAMSVTPNRRPHVAGSGATPLAKRVPERVAVSSNMLQLTADQVSAMVQGVKSQMDSDTMWLGKIVEAVNMHGDQLDAQHESIKAMTDIQQGFGRFAQEMNQSVSQLTQKTSDDDELIRASVNSNDESLKLEINSNDIDIRKLIATRDALTEASLLTVSTRLEAAIADNANIRVIIDTKTTDEDLRADVDHFLAWRVCITREALDHRQ